MNEITQQTPCAMCGRKRFVVRWLGYKGSCVKCFSKYFEPIILRKGSKMDNWKEFSRKDIEKMLSATYSLIDDLKKEIAVLTIDRQGTK